MITRKPARVVLAGKIAADIRGGRYAPGERMPSTVDLSVAEGVSYREAQAALQLLRRSGYLTCRGNSRFVADSPLTHGRPPPGRPCPPCSLTAVTDPPGIFPQAGGVH